MNIKMKSIVTVLAMSALAFAADPTAPTAVRAADAAAPVAAAPAPEAAPAAEPAAPAAAPEAQAPAAPAEEIPVEPVAPTAVRAADAAAPVAAAPAEPAPVAAAPAPTQQRRIDPDTLQPAVVYTTTTVPVKTVYVAERANGDTLTLDELRGLVPLRFNIGIQGFLGGYFLSDYTYYDNSFDDFTWRVGLSSVLPLNKFTVAMKIGVLYEQSMAGGTLHYDDRSARTTTVYNLEFKQRKIDVPVLFSFKAPYSNLMFDLGLQASFAVYDKFELSSTENGKKRTQRIDMLDDGSRKKMGWDLVFGFEYWANKHIALDVRFDGGFTDIYDSYDDGVIKLSDLSSSAFLIGLSYYFL